MESTFTLFNQNIKLISVLACILLLYSEEQEQLKHCISSTLWIRAVSMYWKRTPEKHEGLELSFYILHVSYYLENSRICGKTLAARLIILIRPALFKNKSKADAKTGPGDKYLSSSWCSASPWCLFSMGLLWPSCALSLQIPSCLTAACVCPYTSICLLSSAFLRPCPPSFPYPIPPSVILSQLFIDIRSLPSCLHHARSLYGGRKFSFCSQENFNLVKFSRINLINLLKIKYNGR